MSISTQPEAPRIAQDDAVPTEPIFRLSVEQYHEMLRAGIIADDDPVELLEGWLVTKMGKNPPHRLSNKLLYDLISRVLPAGWHVDAQSPTTTARSEPEPDLYVARGDARQYSNRHPGPADVSLVVEVSDASLARDRGAKKRIYADAAIPTYWIVNLIDRRVEVYTDPTGPDERPDYRSRTDHGPDDAVPLVLDGVEVARLLVREFLP